VGDVAEAHNGSVQLWWDEEGTGDPVLLIMGFSYPSAMWHRVWPALTDRYRVIRFDNRGVGKSDAPKEPWSIADMADDAIAVLDAAGVSRAHVYGASMGGGIAQELALRHPERVASLVLGCTAAPPKREGGPQKIPRIFRVIPPSLLIRARAHRGYGEGTPESAIKDDRAILRATRMSSGGLLNQARAVAAYDSQDRVSQIDVPTLVIHGDHDQTVPVEMGRELASRIPGAQLAIIPGAGHNFITSIDSPANHLVKEFLERQPAPLSAGPLAVRSQGAAPECCASG
jgi:pimeloyl-ACP methyl ester carboxylesterase